VLSRWRSPPSTCSAASRSRGACWRCSASEDGRRHHDSSLATVAYIGATILFILSLGGLSNPETARRGNLFGMIGMAIAVLATVLGPRVTPAGIPWIVGALVVGGAIGLFAAKKVQMTQMPELVALMHSLVGLAACLVGFASYVDTSTVFPTAPRRPSTRSRSTSAS
jgi:NAD/NADP transhydrogenase beta subunit